MMVTFISVLTRTSINPQLIYFWINQGIIAYEHVNFCKHISAFEFYEFQSSIKSCFQFNILLSPPLNWLKAEHIWTTFNTSTCHNLAPTHKLLVYEVLITAPVPQIICMVPSTDHLRSVCSSRAWINGCMYHGYTCTAVWHVTTDDLYYR
jgi:hypothetical protein